VRHKTNTILNCAALYTLEATPSRDLNIYLNELDPELQHGYSGLIPGTVGANGYSAELADYTLNQTDRTARVLTYSTGLPVVSSAQIVSKLLSLPHGLGTTDPQTLDESLSELIGPDQATWVDPNEGHKILHQVSHMCYQLNRGDRFKDFREASTVFLYAMAPPPTGLGLWNFLYHIVVHYELYLRILLLQETGGGWTVGVQHKIAANILIAKRWLDGVDHQIEPRTESITVLPKAHTRQLEGLVRFAEILKWPYLNEVRQYTNTVYSRLLGGGTIPADMMDWLFSVFLPGARFSNKIMSALAHATASFVNAGVGPPPYVRSGLVIHNNSWWRVRTVLGAVLGACRGVVSVCGWVGPCPGVSNIRETRWIRVRAKDVDFRPDRFAKGTFSEEDGGRIPNLFKHRDGESQSDLVNDLGDPSKWRAPPSPPSVSDRCTIINISLDALPLEPSGRINPLDKDTEYAASITFNISAVYSPSGKKNLALLTFQLTYNPTFITSHPCKGTHVVHEREMPFYISSVVSLRDLKNFDGNGMGNKVVIINAKCDGGETVARAWCAEKGKHAVIRRGSGTCFRCSVDMASNRGLGVGVLIWC
jgi:hypothetical protein